MAPWKATRSASDSIRYSFRTARPSPVFVQAAACTKLRLPSSSSSRTYSQHHRSMGLISASNHRTNRNRKSGTWRLPLLCRESAMRRPLLPREAPLPLARPWGGRTGRERI